MEKLSRDRERQIIYNARKDPKQFDALYDTYANSIFNFVLRRVNDTNIAEDITADTFYKALKSIKRFNFRASFSTYLFKIAENEIYRFYRSKKLLPLPINKEFYDVEDPPNVELEGLLQAIEKLPFREREIIRMHFIERKKQNEIAFILNISKSTYYNSMQRALRELKKIVEDDKK
ncbi:MAG: sigma-70 family RNA polymerase sigma factor [Caldisericaceae bacterium]|nr:sigma-70 family RNA polymerase sigma factor [Caldisericaceae bacterium]